MPRSKSKHVRKRHQRAQREKRRADRRKTTKPGR
jgi:hypothetical protein